MMVAAKVTAADCTSCGACCGPELDYDCYVALEASDIHRLPLEYQGQVHQEVNGWRWLKTKEGVNGVTCVALEGRIGECVKCAIYENRPEVCRKFEPGSFSCLDARNIVFGDGSVILDVG